MPMDQEFPRFPFRVFRIRFGGCVVNGKFSQKSFLFKFYVFELLSTFENYLMEKILILQFISFEMNILMLKSFLELSKLIDKGKSFKAFSMIS